MDSFRYDCVQDLIIVLKNSFLLIIKYTFVITGNTFDNNLRIIANIIKITSTINPRKRNPRFLNILLEVNPDEEY